MGQAQPAIEELVANGMEPAAATQQVLSNRDLAAHLFPEKLSQPGQKSLGGQAAMEARRIRRAVEAILGMSA